MTIQDEQRIARLDKALDLAMDQHERALGRGKIKEALSCFEDATKYAAIVSALRLRSQAKEYEV